MNVTRPCTVDLGRHSGGPPFRRSVIPEVRHERTQRGIGVWARQTGLTVTSLYFTLSIFHHFCSFDLEVDPMTTVIHRPISLNFTRIRCRYTGCANTDFLHQGFPKSSSDIHTDSRQIRYIAPDMEQTFLFQQNYYHQWFQQWYTTQATLKISDCLID